MSKQSKKVSILTANVITTICISIVLVLLGCTILVNLTSKNLSNVLKDSFSFSIEMPGNSSDVNIIKVKSELQNNPYILKYDYISKEEVKNQLIKDLGVDPSEVLGYDPSNSYFVVFLKGEYVYEEKIEEVKKSLNNLKIIDNKSISNEDINNINHKLSITSYFLLFSTLVMIVICVVLIRSIIQLNIHSKRFLIKTMQLVGATNAFIRGPFLRTMFGYAIVAWLLACCLIFGIIYYLISSISAVVNIVNVEMLIICAAILLLASIMISLYATATAVNRYLKMNSDKLYKL